MCHGAGGLAAHYRFGARTGGSNIMIGIIFVIIAVAFGVVGLALLSSIPYAVLGVLLLFAGLELVLLIRDVEGRKDLFIVFLIAGIGLATTNMAIAFGAGIAVTYLLKWTKINI
jgi:SulP family sulfate permease